MARIRRKSRQIIATIMQDEVIHDSGRIMIMNRQVTITLDARILRYSLILANTGFWVVVFISVLLLFGKIVILVEK